MSHPAPESALAEFTPDRVVLLVFALVYLGMLLGRVPGLLLDRTGIALLGAIALLISGRVTTAEAWAAIDVPTIGLLFGLMVVSAQFRLGGAYTALARRVAGAQLPPAGLLALVIAVTGAMSAVLVNDIVCLAFTPLLVEGCLRRGLNPRPFLLGLACASNVGSAATLIGNPQNMLIGQALQLSFAGYLWDGVPVSVAGCLATWAIIAWQFRSNWTGAAHELHVQGRTWHGIQTLKGVVVLTALIALFLASPWPREVLALAAAGVLLLNRQLHSRHMLSQVDWQVLVLFAGLFIVNHAFAAAGLLARTTDALAQVGVDPRDPAWLFGVTAVLSNLVSNVPAVMLLLPSAQHEQAGPILALSSTLAGNLLIVGSIANIIVVEQAASLGVRIGWREHARVGVPVTLVTLAIAASWLALRAAAI